MEKIKQGAQVNIVTLHAHTDAQTLTQTCFLHVDNIFLIFICLSGKASKLDKFFLNFQFEYICYMNMISFTNSNQSMIYF